MRAEKHSQNWVWQLPHHLFLFEISGTVGRGVFPRTSSRKKQQQKDDTVCFAVWFWNNFYVVPSSCFSLQEILYSILVTDRLIWHYDILNHMFHTLWPHHCLCFDSSRPVWRCIRNRGKHPPRALAETICCSFLTCQWGHHADRWLIAYFIFSHNMHMFLVYFVFFYLESISWYEFPSTLHPGRSTAGTYKSHFFSGKLSEPKSEPHDYGSHVSLK